VELIEEAASDERNFVKKAVNMALRATGKRSLPLHKATTATAKRLAASVNPSARWIGKDALKELKSPKVIQRVRKNA
jgi:3-methyladenine DNA glycosylase AlkD